MQKIIILATIVAMAMAIEQMSFSELRATIEASTQKSHETIQPSSVVLNSIVQRVDNFDIQNEATFEQRYYMNGENFREGGPLFVFLGGEWTITPNRLIESHMSDIAREFQGYTFYLEHRFYGESFPTEDVSNENLRFLTVEQALADIAHFITHIKSLAVTPGAQNSEVILVGAHYSASLAVWFRQKYPHLALGVWASSAPLLTKVDHYEYKELAGAVYRRVGGNACYDKIESGFRQTEQLFADGNNEAVEEIFQLCQGVVKQNDIATFFTAIAELYSVLPQVSGPDFIAQVCNGLQEEAESDVHAIAKLITDFLTPERCINLNWDYLVETDRQINLNATTVQSGVRQWSYQACTQLGWFHSSTSNYQPFGSSFPIGLFFESCEAVFGETFSNRSVQANVNRFNAVSGGLTPSITNVVFTHGEHDPWRSVGVQGNLNDDATLIVIAGAWQSQDLFSISSYDTPQMILAKIEVKAIIRRWIARAGGIEVVPL